MKLLFNAWRGTAHPLAGGSEVLVDRLAAGMAARGHDVTLCCGRPGSEHVYRVVEGGGRLTQFVRSPIHYGRRFRDRDLVVDMANGMAHYTPLWRRRRPTICFVNHVHTPHWAQWFSPPAAALGRTLERRAMPWAYRHHLFVAVSPSTAEDLEALGVAPTSIRIVHNGVDLPPRTGRKAAEPLFAAVGRLVPHKRYDMLARAWRRVRPHIGGRLVVVGEGPERATIEAMDVPGLELLGHVPPDVKERVLEEAWLLLHPSELEGWGLVIMEAAAHATPTLGFDVRGVRDAVVAGTTGVLVDDEDQFVDAWRRLAADAQEREQLGAAARARAELFSWDRTVDEFEKIAEEAILRSPPR